MDLYILRHAIAVPHGAPGIERDSDRPLTPKGAGKMRRIAKGMRALDLSIGRILSSPFPRARQTAEIVAEEFGLQKRLSFTEHLAVGGDMERLIEQINDEYGTEPSVMLVGHEPSLSSLISVLVSGDGGLDITMKKGGLCRLTVDTLRYRRCATLEWLLTPRVLTRIG